jgi:peptide/nickel transport system permease protein
MVLCFPNIFLLLFLAAFISPGLGTVALIIGLTAWMEVARIVHAQVLALKEQDFILAAQLLGLPRWQIVLRHILPNTMAPILVAATLNIANAILLESYISFLGYGIQPPTASWGNMLNNAQSDFALDPWLAIFPGIMITLAVMSFNFIGDGLRDALDPRLKV